MDKIKSFFNTKIMPLVGKLANQRHMMAIRNGVVSTIPFVIVGATCLLILSFPLSGEAANAKYLKDYLSADFNNMLLFIYRYGLGAMGLFAAWGIGSELGKSYKFSQTTSGLIAVFGFLLFILPLNGSTISIGAIGGASIFLSIVSGLAAVELLHFCKRFHITVKMPSSVPEAVSASFELLIPVIGVAFLFGGIRVGIGFDLAAFMKDILGPLQSVLTGSAGGVILIILFVTLFWWVGIHGTSMVEGVVRPFWQTAIQENSDWFQNGSKGDIPNMFPEPFLQWLVWIGGAGATIGLVIAALIFARSKQVRMVARVSAVPSIFNINEPVIFGFPVMLNPILFIPFIFTPIAMALVGWALMAWWGVHMVVLSAWTLPSPIGAYFSSGADYKAIFISLINIAVAIGIWTPFLIMYDRKVQKDEAVAEGIDLKDFKPKTFSFKKIVKTVKAGK